MFYNGVGTSNTFEPFAHIGGKQNDLKVGAGPWHKLPQFLHCCWTQLYQQGFY